MLKVIYRRKSFIWLTVPEEESNNGGGGMVVGGGQSRKLSAHILRLTQETEKNLKSGKA